MTTASPLPDRSGSGSPVTPVTPGSSTATGPLASAAVLGDLDTRWPRRPRRLATGVLEELADRIASGTLPTGALLPNEAVLCTTFGVSRTVVREAVKGLEDRGLVTVQQGQGTHVRPLADWDLVDPLVLSVVIRHDAALAILDDLVEVRATLEGTMAAQAAERADDEQRAAITRRMDDLDRRTDDPAAYLAADVAFHDAILEASGNRLGRAMIRTLQAEAYRSLRYIGDPSTADMVESNVAHRSVHDRVLDGDTLGAQQAMVEHILASWRRRRPTRSDEPTADLPPTGGRA